jgi:hypothetical protein
VNFIVLNTNAQQLDDLLNVFRRLRRVARQVSRRWAMTSTGARVFGSMIEHASAIREFKQAVRCNNTAEGLGMR